MLVVPGDRGGWRSVLISGAAEEGPFNPLVFTLPDDPTLPQTVVVTPLGLEGDEYLVVPPRGATSVIGVGPGGIAIGAPVVGGAARLRIPDRTSATVQALDASGAPIGSGRPGSTDVPTGTVDRWSEVGPR